jgi:enterochelin esterase-like enzyme/outer membrane protein assembly factor BamB
VVSDGMAVTGYCDSEFGYIGCFNTETGQQIWRHQTGPKYKGTNGSFDGPIATPAIGLGRVFMFTPAGDLIALDLKSGELRWQLNVMKTFKVKPIFYGFGSSPVIVDNKLLLEIGPPIGTLCAFNPVDGKVLWTHGDDMVGYQNPIAIRQGKDLVVVYAGNTKVAGVRPSDGKELFNFAHKGTGFQGAMSMIPVPLENETLFLTHDDARSQAVMLQSSGTEMQAKPLWEQTTIRRSYVVPVTDGNRIFGFNSRILSCVDGQTGKLQWRSRASGDGFISVVDNHLVTLTKKGSLHIASSQGKSYEEQCQTEIFEDVTWSIPAIDGDAIYVRSIGEIARVDIVPRTRVTPVLVKRQAVGPKFQSWLAQVEKSPKPQQEVDQLLGSLKSTPLIEGDIAHFLLKGDYSDVAVVSDLFGARQERKMTQLAGTDLFYLAAKLPLDARVSYAFVADYKTLLDPKNSRAMKSTLFVEDMELLFARAAETLELSWFDMPQHRKGIDLDEGKPLAGSFDSFQITSQPMKNEKIQVAVYLPPNYRKAGKSYPVIFIHDGAPARKLGKLDVLVDRMIAQGKIDPAVLVFIHRGFHPLMGAPGYMEMFSQELMPEIDKRYNVSTERMQRSSYGAGFGGLLALTSGLTSRSQIGRIGLPAIYSFDLHKPMIDNGLTVKGPQPEVMLQTATFGITNPTENWDMSKSAGNIGQQLQNAGHPLQLENVNDGSDWICWRGQADKFFTFLLGK